MIIALFFVYLSKNTLESISKYCSGLNILYSLLILFVGAIFTKKCVH